MVQIRKQKMELAPRGVGARRFSVILTVAALVFVFVSSNALCSITLYPTDDTYARSTRATTNYGSEMNFSISNQIGPYVGFLKFSLTSLSSTERITDITLTLRAESANNPGGTFKVY